MPTWEEFAEWALGQASVAGGRAALRRRWATLRQLADKVSDHLTPGEIEALLGKPYDQLDPEHNDLKALVAYGAGKGIISDPSELQNVLRADALSDPLYFLAAHSGKTFGEKWAPSFAKFWLVLAGDTWVKQSTTGFYDLAWTPRELGRQLRIELKGSSERPGFLFQQVRHPKLSGSGESDYDLLLCLGVSAGALEWWAIPAEDLDLLADNGTTPATDVVIIRQHGKRRPIWNDQHGYGDEGWFRTDPRSRDHLAPYECGSSDLLRAKILSSF